MRFRWSTIDPVHIAPNSETIFTRYVKFGQLGSDLRVELLTGGQTISARLVAADDLPMVMPSSRDWVVTLGPDAGVAKALKASRVTEITDTSTLPTEWFGYEGVNTVFISTSDIAALEAITAEQFSALEQWVTLGGRVVMCVGSIIDRTCPASLEPRACEPDQAAGRNAGNQRHQSSARSV